MALTGCYGLIKWLVVLVNFIFWLAGLAVLILSVWMLTDPTFYLSMAQDESSYNTGVYILLATGILMFVVAFLGCCGAYKESPCMLVSFFCFLLIIVVAEIAAGAWGYNNRAPLEDSLRDSITTTVKEEYGTVQTRTVTFDAIQKGMQCCGANGPNDWSGSRYNNADKSGIDLTFKSLVQMYRIPASCCTVAESSVACVAGQEVGTGASISGIMYSQGCIDKMIETLRQHMSIVLGVGLGIIIIEALGLVFSLVLCCAIHNTEHRYKA
uniref:Tetraspanin n=3 Tax=Timema TaxID=61471 RepID=A0A7R9NY30_9NEOP|nr:unnamed protein product [Timema bartmani]CAD7460419.1 unnamed protein product [Timema tahoe]